MSSVLHTWSCLFGLALVSAIYAPTRTTAPFTTLCRHTCTLGGRLTNSERVCDKVEAKEGRVFILPVKARILGSKVHGTEREKQICDIDVGREDDKRERTGTDDVER